MPAGCRFAGRDGLLKQRFKKRGRHCWLVCRLSRGGEQQTKPRETAQRHPHPGMGDGETLWVHQKICIVVGADLAPQQLADDLRQRFAGDVLQQFGQDLRVRAWDNVSN